jgi:hypothetical protein
MSADPYGHAPDAMQGYVALIGAILQRALADSRLRVRHGTQGHTHPTREDQEDARALLLSHERLRFFCELTGAEVSRVQAALLTAAGLPSPRPLGASRGATRRPRPRNAGGSRSRLRPRSRSLLSGLRWTGLCGRWPDTLLAHARTVALVALQRCCSLAPRA